MLQDAIINDTLTKPKVVDYRNGNVCTTPTTPFVVFTAGWVFEMFSHSSYSQFIFFLHEISSNSCVAPWGRENRIHWENSMKRAGSHFQHLSLLWAVRAWWLADNGKLSRDLAQLSTDASEWLLDTTRHVSSGPLHRTGDTWQGNHTPLISGKMSPSRKWVKCWFHLKLYSPS